MYICLKLCFKTNMNLFNILCGNSGHFGVPQHIVSYLTPSNLKLFIPDDFGSTILINLLKNKIIPPTIFNTGDADKAAMWQKYELVEVLCNLGVLCSSNAADYAAIKGDLKMLNLLRSYNILCSGNILILLLNTKLPIHGKEVEVLDHLVKFHNVCYEDSKGYVKKDGTYSPNFVNDELVVIKMLLSCQTIDPICKYIQNMSSYRLSLLFKKLLDNFCPVIIEGQLDIANYSIIYKNRKLSGYSHLLSLHKNVLDSRQTFWRNVHIPALVNIKNEWRWYISHSRVTFDGFVTIVRKYMTDKGIVDVSPLSIFMYLINEHQCNKYLIFDFIVNAGDDNDSDLLENIIQLTLDNDYDNFNTKILITDRAIQLGKVNLTKVLLNNGFVCSIIGIICAVTNNWVWFFEVYFHVIKNEIIQSQFNYIYTYALILNNVRLANIFRIMCAINKIDIQIEWTTLSNDCIVESQLSSMNYDTCEYILNNHKITNSVLEAIILYIGVNSPHPIMKQFVDEYIDHICREPTDWAEFVMVVLNVDKYINMHASVKLVNNNYKRLLVNNRYDVLKRALHSRDNKLLPEILLSDNIDNKVLDHVLENTDNAYYHFVDGRNFDVPLLNYAIISGKVNLAEKIKKEIHDPTSNIITSNLHLEYMLNKNKFNKKYDLVHIMSHIYNFDACEGISLNDKEIKNLLKCCILQNIPSLFELIVKHRRDRVVRFMNNRDYGIKYHLSIISNCYVDIFKIQYQYRLINKKLFDKHTKVLLNACNSVTQFIIEHTKYRFIVPEKYKRFISIYADLGNKFTVCKDKTERTIIDDSKPTIEFLVDENFDINNFV